MFGKSRAAGAAAASLSLLLAAGNAGCCPDGTFPPCPAGDGTSGVTTLVDETHAFAVPARHFNPSAAGKTIRVTVSGDATTSRIAVLVSDLATGNVVAQENSPTSNSTTVSFVSTNNGTHDLATLEVGAGASTYVVLITEQWG